MGETHQGIGGQINVIMIIQQVQGIQGRALRYSMSVKAKGKRVKLTM
jgi:hypothetical protein